MDKQLIEAVQRGEESALSAWADAFERAGANGTADLLRWLPPFHAMIAEEVREVSPQSGFSVMPNPNGTAWWWIGDMCSESDNEDARRLGRLIASWNETHPAVEWLLRRLGLPHVNVEASTSTSDACVETKRYDLTAGQHLEPLSADLRVLRLDVPAWEEE